MPTDFLLIVARALACPIRLHVLRLLGDEGMCVSAVADAAGISMSTASVHLSQLARAGLVTRVRVGRMRLYRWPRRRLHLVFGEDENVSVTEPDKCALGRR